MSRKFTDDERRLFDETLRAFDEDPNGLGFKGYALRGEDGEFLGFTSGGSSASTHRGFVWEQDPNDEWGGMVLRPWRDSDGYQGGA